MSRDFWVIALAALFMATILASDNFALELVMTSLMFVSGLVLGGQVNER